MIAVADIELAIASVPWRFDGLTGILNNAQAAGVRHYTIVLDQWTDELVDKLRLPDGNIRLIRLTAEDAYRGGPRRLIEACKSKLPVVAMVDDDISLKSEYFETIAQVLNTRNIDGLAFSGWSQRTRRFVKAGIMPRVDIPLVETQLGRTAFHTTAIADFLEDSEFKWLQPEYFAPDGSDERLFSCWLWKRGRKIIAPSVDYPAKDMIDLCSDNRAMSANYYSKRRAQTKKLSELFNWYPTGVNPKWNTEDIEIVVASVPRRIDGLLAILAHALSTGIDTCCVVLDGYPDASARCVLRLVERFKTFRIKRLTDKSPFRGNLARWWYASISKKPLVAVVDDDLRLCGDYYDRLLKCLLQRNASIVTWGGLKSEMNVYISFYNDIPEQQQFYKMQGGRNLIVSEFLRGYNKEPRFWKWWNARRGEPYIHDEVYPSIWAYLNDGQIWRPAGRSPMECTDKRHGGLWDHYSSRLFAQHQELVAAFNWYPAQHAQKVMNVIPSQHAQKVMNVIPYEQTARCKQVTRRRRQIVRLQTG